jgi:hypothetical protein
LLAVCEERLFVHDNLLFATPFQLILDVILEVLHNSTIQQFNNSKDQGEKYLVRTATGGIPSCSG